MFMHATFRYFLIHLPSAITSPGPRSGKQVKKWNEDGGEMSLKEALLSPSNPTSWTWSGSKLGWVNGEDSHTRMLVIVLLVIAKNWKHLKYPLTGHRLNKLWCIHAREFYATVKKNDLEPFELVQNNLQKKQDAEQSASYVPICLKIKGHLLS